MHNEPIVAWRNGDPIAPVPASDVVADTVEDGSVAPEQPLFLPVIFPDPMDNDVATIAPLRAIPVDTGAEYAQGAADQGSLAANQGAVQGAADQGALAANQGARAPADEEIEGVSYKVIERDDDDDDLPVLRHYESDDDSDDDDDKAPRYSLRRQQPPPFASYANPNGIDDVDLDPESSTSDFSTDIDVDNAQLISFTQYACPALGGIGGVELSTILPHLQALKQPQEQSQELTFEKGDKPSLVQ